MTSMLKLSLCGFSLLMLWQLAFCQCEGATRTKDEQISCLTNLVNILTSVVEPRQPIPFDQWPGNSVCVTCNFLAGLFVAVVEGGLLYLALTRLFSCNPRQEVD